MYNTQEELNIKDFLDLIGFVPPRGFTLDMIEPVKDNTVENPNLGSSENFNIPTVGAADEKVFTHDSKNKLESVEQDPSFFREPASLPEPKKVQWYTPIETNPKNMKCPLCQVRDWDDLKTYEITEGVFKGTRLTYLKEEKQ